MAPTTIAQMDPLKSLGHEQHTNKHNALADAVNALHGAMFNVKEYGATGDGVTNDRTAIMATLAAADAAGGGTVIFPVGTYLVGAAIDGYHAGINIIGMGGQYAVRIKSSGNFAPLSGSWDYCTITHITLDAGDLGGRGMHAYVNHTTLDHVTVVNWNTAGITLNDGTQLGYGGADLGYLNRIVDCNVDSPVAGTGYGIYTTYRFTDSWIERCNVGSTSANIRTESGPLRIIDNHLDGSPEYNILMEGPNRVTVEGNILEGALKSSIYFQMPSFESGHTQHQIQIVGNAISNGGYSPSRLAAVPGTYPAIHILGKSASDRTLGILVTGNLIAVEQPLAGWSAALYCKWADQITATGNSWATGYDDTNPVTLEGCGTVYDVVGNGGRNAVTTI